MQKKPVTYLTHSPYLPYYGDMVNTSDKVSEFRIRNIPDEAYRRLKALAALEGKNVNDKLIEMILKEIEKLDTGKS